MAEVLKGLISGDELHAEHVERRLDHEQKVVVASTAALLDAKVQLEIQEGWEIKRPLKRSTVLKKSKPTDVWVEDRLWSLFKDLGFAEMNRDRQFMIQEAGGTQRQIDIFAKDRECVFFVECTHQKEYGPRSMKGVIDKVRGYKQAAIAAVHKHYGTEPKLKIKFAIFTRNIAWSSEDSTRADTDRIAVITEPDIEYYERLYRLLRTAARFQFLGRFLKGESVEGLRLPVPATRGKAGDATFYNFLVSPYHLLRIGYINHRVSTSNDDFGTYQRMVKPSRLKEIGEFLDGGGKFPTNIVINFKPGSDLQFQLTKSFDDTATGMLTLPGLYGSAWIIDGQHRLYGYARTKRGEQRDHSVVSVLAYDQLPLTEEIAMFVDINMRQVKIKTALVEEIISDLNIEADDAFQRLEALYANLAIKMDKDPSSPLFGRINITGSDKSHRRCITSVSITAQAKAANLLGKAIKGAKSKERSLALGPLADHSGKSKDILAKATSTLSLYFGLFSSRLQDHWNLGNERGGFLCTNTGLRPLILLLSKLIAFVEKRDDVKFHNMSPKESVEAVKSYVEPLLDYFAQADEPTTRSFRNRTALKGVTENCFQMMAIINDARPHFTTPELDQYKRTRDAEGTKEAKSLIAEMNKIIFDNVTATLQDGYGSDPKDWWMQGVPPAIRNQCDKMFNNTDGKSERWNHLSLANYPDIVLYSKNWDLFKDYYAFNGRGKRVDQVSWLSKIAKCKAVTDNAERGPLSPDDVRLVRRVHELVTTHIAGETKVDGKTSYLASNAERAPALAEVA